MGELELSARTRRLLIAAGLASALALGVSEFMTTFEFNAAGGDTLRSAEASDRHSWAILVLAVFAAAMLLAYARAAVGPAAIAAAAAGLVALGVFLIGDLPDVNEVGDLSDPILGLATARAEPQPGFFLELVGAIGLALSAGALASARPAAGDDEESSR